MTGLLTDKPGEIISFFDDGRGSCKDLGVNLDKKLASSYISNYTTGVQVQHPPGDPSGFSWKKFAKENFTDPAKDWANTSAKNWENSFNDSFDEQQALKLLGEMCTLEDLYKEFFDKLDLVSLLCDWLKCIRLPNFNLKLPNFYLPPLPQIPILGWYAAVINFFIDNIKQILVRIVCTFVRSIIDKLAIPFCEEQLRDFIAAGSSSGSPIMDRAIADALMNTGVPSNKKEEAKNFFDDVASITTGQELCHLLSGKSLDDASMLMIQRLLEKNGLEEDLDSRESLMNYFDLLGTFIPDGLCEELQKSTTLNAPSDCFELADFLQDIRNRLQTEDSSLSDEEIERVINLAKDEMENRKESLAAFSGNNIGNLLPQAYGPGNPDAIISSYPDFLKKELEKTAKNSFTSARMSYVNALDSYVPNLSISAPSTPRAGTDRYNDIQSLNFEAAATQLSLYAQGVQSSANFARRKMLQKLGLDDDVTREELESYIYKGRELHHLAKVAKSWITWHLSQIGSNKFREHGSYGLQAIAGSNHDYLWNGVYPALSETLLSHVDFTDEMRLTSTDGTREGNTMIITAPPTEVKNNPFLAEGAEENLEKIINLIDTMQNLYDPGSGVTQPQEMENHFHLDYGVFGFHGDTSQQAQMPHVPEIWQRLNIEPFDITPAQSQWLAYFTVHYYGAHYYGFDQRVHAHRGIAPGNLHNLASEMQDSHRYDFFTDLKNIIRNQESLSLQLNREFYHLIWCPHDDAHTGYYGRIKREVHDKLPEWEDRYRPREGFIEPFIEEIKDYRIGNIDDTLAKLKLIIREYMLKTGFSDRHLSEDGYRTWEDFRDQILTPAYREEPDQTFTKYYVHRNGGSRMDAVPGKFGSDKFYFAHKYRGIKLDDYGNRAYMYYVWYSAGSNVGSPRNHTEESFVENFIMPAKRSDQAGIPWNHELRSVEVLDELAKLTDTAVDPYTAAITSLEDVGGVSWWNTLLLFSVFETEDVPLQTRSGTHRVFRRAELPIKYNTEEGARSFKPYKEFISYYRRPPVEGTVHDYVQGERTFNYVREGFDGNPTFEQRGAVYDEVFNKIIDQDPFPIETYYTPYERFYEQTNDPLEKAEHAMIVPSFLADAGMFGEAKEMDMLYRLELSDEEINDRYAKRIRDAHPWERPDLRSQRDKHKQSIREYVLESYEERERLAQMQLEYARSAIDIIEASANSFFKRDLPTNHPARIRREADWNGEEHLYFIEDFIFLMSLANENDIAVDPGLKYRNMLLKTIYMDIYPMISEHPPNFYRVMKAALDTNTGVYTVADPARGFQNYSSSQYVPIFPVSMTNAAVQSDEWLSHTYFTLVSMAIAVHGGVPDFFRKRINDPRDADNKLDDAELQALFTDFRLQDPESAKETVTAICHSLHNTINSPNLIKFTNDRLKELTDTIQRGLEFRPNFITDRHLLMLDKILSESQIVSFDNDLIQMFAEFGTYKPKITLEELPAEKDFDRYNVTVESDFHLRMPNPQNPKVFQMCEFLPESLTRKNSPSEAQLSENSGPGETKYFSKRESFAQMVLENIRSYLPDFNMNDDFKNILYDDLYKNIRNTMFSKASNVISTSDLFDFDYASLIDDRLSAEPVYDPGTECVTNRYGLVEAATLSFNKVIMDESYTEIMKEISKPENSPFNRDFDDPHPLELAMQSISLKAFIRVCLIDTLLKGGLVYSMWDIEPIISNQLFKDYIFEHVARELKASRFFGPNWKRIIERTVGITNPTAALKHLLEKEMVKLPDYSKQVFNFTADKRNKDYYNWPLENMLSFEKYDFQAYEQGLQNTDQFQDLSTTSPLRVLASQIEQSAGRDGVSIWDFGITSAVADSVDLKAENYIKLSGEIIENINEINTAIQELFLTAYDGRPIPSWDELLRWAAPDQETGLPTRGPVFAYNSNVRRYYERSHWYFPMLNIRENTPAQRREDLSISEGESFVTTPAAFDALLSSMHAALPRDQFVRILENSTIHHGSRLVMTTNDETIINQIRNQEGIRRKSYQTHALLGISLYTTGLSDFEVFASEVLKLPLVQHEHELKIEDCGLPSGDMFSDTLLNDFNNFNRAGQDYNSQRSVHTDFVTNGFLESQEFKNVTEHIFPLRRFLSINSIFATSIISGYNGIPVLFDSVKTSIAFVAKVASTPASQQLELVSITPDQFGTTALKNWPSHPQSADCFDFPLPGKEFFKKFIEDLWKLIKQLPSILFRGVANQLDPAYKEMRQHYLNCNIKNLTWDGIRIHSAMDGDRAGLVNGLVYPRGTIQEGKNRGKYVPILPSLVFDELISRAHLLAFNPAPLGRTIARTITYAFNGMAPFYDLSMAFQVPCAGIDENWLDKAKYDLGKFGRYGHPISPFTALALSTPQLESDKKLKRPNCIPGSRPKLAEYDECDE